MTTLTASQIARLLYDLDKSMTENPGLADEIRRDLSCVMTPSARHRLLGMMDGMVEGRETAMLNPPSDVRAKPDCKLFAGKRIG